MLVHVTVRVNAQQHCSCVYRRSHQYRRSHVRLLGCNVCGGITAVGMYACGGITAVGMYVCGGITAEVLSRCRSLYVTLCGSLWTSMASQPSFRLPHTLWFLSVCWPPTRRVYNITSSSLLHKKYLLLLYCVIKVSQYQLALIDTAFVHLVMGISQHIHSSCRLRVIFYCNFYFCCRVFQYAFCCRGS